LVSLVLAPGEKPKHVFAYIESIQKNKLKDMKLFQDIQSGYIRSFTDISSFICPALNSQINFTVSELVGYTGKTHYAL
jgi:hypothetical protein